MAVPRTLSPSRHSQVREGGAQASAHRRAWRSSRASSQNMLATLYGVPNLRACMVVTCGRGADVCVSMPVRWATVGAEDPANAGGAQVAKNVPHHGGGLQPPREHAMAWHARVAKSIRRKASGKLGVRVVSEADDHPEGNTMCSGRGGRVYHRIRRGTRPAHGRTSCGTYTTNSMGCA